MLLSKCKSGDQIPKKKRRLGSGGSYLVLCLARRVSYLGNCLDQLDFDRTTLSLDHCPLVSRQGFQVEGLFLR